MNPAIHRNRAGLILATLLMSATVISCSFVKDLSGRGESEKTRKLNESVPAGMNSSERDFEVTQPSAFRVVLSEPGQILLGNADAQTIDIASLDTQLKALYDSTMPDRRVVYLIATSNIPTSEIAAILDRVRENGINIVKLVTSSRLSDEDRGYFTKIPPPDRTIEVRVRKEVMFYRPNPLTLLVATAPDGMPVLNSEPQDGLDDLTVRLSEVFKQREANGVFRENTNEVEKTVLVDVPRKDENRRYGDLVKLVDAVKLSGASPIVLGDKGAFANIPEPPSGDELDIRPPSMIEPGTRTPDGKSPANSISGGVLNGKATSLPKPPYPPAARAVKASGAVTVQVTVDTGGTVIEASAVSGHPLLRAAAVAAARSARFEPTLLSGKPVKVTGVLVYNFSPSP